MIFAEHMFLCLKKEHFTLVKKREMYEDQSPNILPCISPKNDYLKCESASKCAE